MLHETVTSVVGLLLKIYLYKHDEDLIKHSNSKYTTHNFFNVTQSKLSTGVKRYVRLPCNIFVTLQMAQLSENTK